MLFTIVIANDYIVQYTANANVIPEIEIGDFKASLISRSSALRMRKDPSVKRIVKNELQDMLFNVQENVTWGIDRIDAMGMDNKYDYPSIAGKDTVAYILDTGINTKHVDFENRATFGFDATGEGMVDNNGHGTHVAGVVGGLHYGVAKQVNLVAVKVCNGSGQCRNSWVLKGLEFAVKRMLTTGLKSTINMSLGIKKNSLWDDAVKAVVKSGIVVVVAAGNSATDACTYSPANVPEVITVGATNRVKNQDTMASFSNNGKCVDVNAPGVGITSAWKDSLTGSKTISGTSISF